MDWRSQEGRVRQGAEGKYALLKVMERWERKQCSNGSEEDQCFGKTGARLFQWVGVLLWVCKSSEGARESWRGAKRSGRMSVKAANSASDEIMKKSRYRYSQRGSGRAATSQGGCLASTALPRKRLARAVRHTLQNSTGPLQNLAGLLDPSLSPPTPHWNE